MTAALVCPTPEVVVDAKARPIKPARLEELWAVVEMAAAGGEANVDQETWETWRPGGAEHKTGGHIGKRTMRRLRDRGWLTTASAQEKSRWRGRDVLGAVATLTTSGWDAAALFAATGYSDDEHGRQFVVRATARAKRPLERTILRAIDAAGGQIAIRRVVEHVHCADCQARTDATVRSMAKHGQVWILPLEALV